METKKQKAGKAKYVDGFVLSITKKNVGAYKKLAREAKQVVEFMRPLLELEAELAKAAQTPETMRSRKAVGKALKDGVTTRNWATVLKLHTLAVG